MISTSPTTDPRIIAGAQAILQACERYVPANANIDEAIEAHRLAFAESGRSLAAYAIRVVIFAATKTREQAQRQVDYLTSLPIEAWEGLVSGDAAEVREETLGACARTIADDRSMIERLSAASDKARRFTPAGFFLRSTGFRLWSAKDGSKLSRPVTTSFGDD